MVDIDKISLLELRVLVKGSHWEEVNQGQFLDDTWMIGSVEYLVPYFDLKLTNILLRYLSFFLIDPREYVHGPWLFL